MALSVEGFQTMELKVMGPSLLLCGIGVSCIYITSVVDFIPGVIIC